MQNKSSDRLLELLENEMFEEFDKERQTVRQTAKEQIQKAQDMYKKQYDKKRKEEVIYKEGDLVAYSVCSWKEVGKRFSRTI